MFGKKYLGLKGFPLNMAIATIAGLDFLLFGYDQGSSNESERIAEVESTDHDVGVMGGLLTLPSFTSVFPEIDVTNPPPGVSSTHTSTIQGISIGSYNLGCFAGAIMTIWLGDLLGRRRVIFLGSTIMVVGAALQASAFSLGHLIAGRVITGVGNGISRIFIFPPTLFTNTYIRHEHVNRANMAIRNVKISQTWTDGHD